MMRSGERIAGQENMRHLYLQKDEGHRDHFSGDRSIAINFPKHIQERSKKRAIICKRCPDYALAKLNGTPLCLSCLMESVGTVIQPSGEIAVKIEPLSILSSG
jgi:hypothetical protein